MHVITLILLATLSLNLNAWTAKVTFTETGMDSYNIYVSDMDGNVTSTPIINGPNSPIFIDFPETVDEVILIGTGVNSRGQSKFSDWAYVAHRPNKIEIDQPEAPQSIQAD